MSVEQRQQHFAVIKSRKGQTVTVFQADRLCCRIGYHPYEVYGDLYFQDLWEKHEQAEAERDSGRKSGR